MDLASIPWPQLGAGGLLTVAVGLILTGGLVPRRSADKWERAYREERELNREEINHIAEATEEQGRTMIALLQSIKGDKQPDQGGG